MFRRIKHTIFEKGFLLTLVLSVCCLVFYFGHLLEKPNHVYFGMNGDAFQSYYTALYHVKHDQHLWHLDGMNYPYGEEVFFTGCQPFLTNAIKIVSKVVDISNATLGIMNLLMLFSVVASALVLYLIFKHLKLQFVFAAFAATGIAFLSPQIDRLGGHYSLTYQFAIPLFLLLLMKFYERPNWKRSIAISLLVFLMAGMHFYFFGFFALLAFFYWAVLFLSKDGPFSKFSFCIKHSFVQIVLPIAIIQLILIAIDPVHDRTAFPLGYLGFKSNLTGVFYPSNRFYEPLFRWLVKPAYPDWEGYCFVGFLGIFYSAGLFLLFLFRLLRGKILASLAVSDNKLLNIFFWAAVFSLALSFGLPFVFPRIEPYLYYSGPLKQLRGIGRFSWNYYYVINILAFYSLYWWGTRQKAVLRFSVLPVFLLFLFHDADIMCRHQQEWKLDNSIETLDDAANQLPQNQWLTRIKTADYQAIIGLPYFNWGSENYWIQNQSSVIRDVFVTSLKTGLPTVNVISSRLSIGQALRNIAIIKEPYRPLGICKDFKNKKPFLVLVRPGDLGDDDKALLALCSKIDSTPDFDVYSLPEESLEKKCEGLYEKKQETIDSLRLFPHGSGQSTDSLSTFVMETFDEQANPKAYRGQGCFEGKIREQNVLYKGILPNQHPGKYVLSFWMDDFNKDLYPRVVVEQLLSDTLGTVFADNYYTPGNNFKAVDGSWGLVEIPFDLQHDNEQIVVYMRHPEIPDGKMLIRIDDLLIRPSHTTVVYADKGKNSILNNRMYIAK